MKDNLTPSHSKFNIKIKQKQILRPSIFPAILLDVDGMLLAINCQQYPRLEHPSLNGTNAPLDYIFEEKVQLYPVPTIVRSPRLL